MTTLEQTTIHDAVRGGVGACAAATALSALVIVPYMLTRTSRLPSSTDDIGNCSEPLGIASLFVEGSLVTVGSAMPVARSMRVGAAVAAGQGTPSRAA